MKDNKLIAEFMGLNTSDGVYYNHIVKEIDKHNSTLSLKKEKSKSELTHFALLEYHTSWNWLMPVVEKIEEDEEIDVNILLNGTRIFKWRTDTDIVNNVAKISFDKKIEHVYDAVVEFIKQHNKES